jgi:hypothetical protein
MATIELNGQVKTITDTFFSKENISTLNKKLLEKNNLTEINKDGKKKIIDLLIKNMKLVYKSLDLKKINKKNFDSIYQQFNKTSYNETQKELRTNDILALSELNASQLKFERDFNSNPNNGNKVSERPVPSQNKNQFLYPPDINQNKGNNNRFDKLFKPIVEQVNENYKFNQYQYGKGSDDINKRIEELTTERENETRMSGRPRTPEFLKPLKTQLEKNDFNNENSRTIQDFPKKSGKPDFTQNISQDELDIGFLSNNDNVDLYNINNIDNPIDLRNIEEDSRSFQERLKSLEHERTSINIPPNKGKIDFTSDTFNNSEINKRNKEIDEIPDYEPKTIEQIREEKYLIEMKKRQEIREQSDLNEQMKREQLIEQMKREQLIEQMKKEQLIEQMKREQINEQIRREQINEQIRREQINEQMKREQLNEQMKREQLNEQMKREQININQLGKNSNKHDIGQQLSKTLLNKNLDISKIQNTLKKLGMVEASEVEKIKKEVEKIKQENEILKNQLSNFNENELIKQDFILEFEKLNNKKTLLTKKIEEMNILMEKYQYLYGTSNIQLDISPNEPLSEFSFEFEPIENIIGIKLMSYSIPQARYNIESEKNNIFQIKNMNNEIIELKLNSGKYSIESLLEKLNTKSEKYKFELNVEQIVEISSDESFEIISTALSKEVLGFTSICKDNTKFIADKSWDLRIEEKIFLFINNIDNTTPFAVLYTNNQGNYQFKFEELIKLDKLELSFKDSNGRPFNFYGLKYNLNIQLELNNPIKKINI